MNVFDWSDWRYLFQHRIGGWFQRANRGYADHDVWSFDTYLAGVMAGGLRELAAHNIGHPCDFPGGADGWNAWLLDKANWLEWYHKDEDGVSDDKGWIAPHLTQEQKSHRINTYHTKMQQFFNEVMPDIGKHFGHLWD